MTDTHSTAPPSPEKDSGSDDKSHGDNPGVGGLPAEESSTEEEARSGRDHRDRENFGGDNPGVGGLPADESLTERN
jgi:hypothetical protein